jgi:signal transduction histidine kinase
MFGFGVMIATLLLFYAGPSLVPSLNSQPRTVALFDLVGGSVMILSLAAVPITVAMALMRRGLWGIDAIMGRTLVYAGLTALVIGVYVGIVGYLGVVLQARESMVVSLVATAVVAIVFQPMRQYLQAGVNRLLYGQRYEPYEAISRLGRSLELTASPDSILPRVVETLRESLKLPYAAVIVEDNGTRISIAESGVAGGETVPIPLTYGTESVGTLRLAPRAVGGRFARAEMKLLDDLARQVGAVAQSVKLDTQLQRARERLIQAREEERRWLSQELHDGLGPLLASQTLTIAAAQRSISVDPQKATRMLGEAIEHAQVAVEDVRRIVGGLRPSTLDSLGLRGALESLVGQFTSPNLVLVVTLPERIPDLQAATEVACYRIAQEALTNTVRHSSASLCEVELGFDGALNLTVIDNGCGIAANSQPGVGLQSMRTRAEELGGSFEIRSPIGHGTRVQVSLPVVTVS